MTFYRPKIGDWLNHEMTRGTRAAIRAYIERDALATGPLMRGSRKDGRLHAAGMSERSIAERVRVLGASLGIEGLSPHDCRHHLATVKAKKRNVKELMEIFGWKSPAMAILYIETSEVVKVEDEPATEPA